MQYCGRAGLRSQFATLTQLFPDPDEEWEEAA